MKFRNKITGIIEDVTNPVLIPQYQKHNDTYEQVKGGKKAKPTETTETTETAVTETTVTETTETTESE